MTLLLIDAGGTISSQPDAQGRLAGSSGGLGALGEVVTRQVYSGLSEEMTFADMARVRDAVLAGLADPAISGVIVAHGTDAMEETAFLTDLALGSPQKPVIFTGAMLPISYPGSDAPANLANALAAARSPALAAHGALVVFWGHLIPAAAVYKHSTTALDGFRWRLGTPGTVLGETVQPPAPLRRAPALAPVLPSGPCPILSLAGGDEGFAIEAALDAGAKGLVLMALGRGNASAGACAAVARAAGREGVPVVVASRCPVGATAPDYATGQRLADAGAVFAGDLGPSQARILLACVLASGGDVAAAFLQRGQLLGAAAPTCA